MHQDDSKEAATESFDGAKPPVDLPELRPPRAYQSVILVADDEPLIRNLVTLLMQRVSQNINLPFLPACSGSTPDFCRLRPFTATPTADDGEDRKGVRLVLEVAGNGAHLK